MATAPEMLAELVLDNPDEATAVEVAHEMRVARVAGLGAVYGFMYECSAGHLHVAINDDLCVAEQRVTYWHEAHHCLSGDAVWCAEHLAECFAHQVARSPYSRLN